MSEQSIILNARNTFSLWDKILNFTEEEVGASKLRDLFCCLHTLDFTYTIRTLCCILQHINIDTTDCM